MKVLIEIDDSIWRAIENLRAGSDKSVDVMVSELIGDALASRRAPFHWISRDMRSLIDLAEEDSVRDLS